MMDVIRQSCHTWNSLCSSISSSPSSKFCAGFSSTLDWGTRRPSSSVLSFSSCCSTSSRAYGQSKNKLWLKLTVLFLKGLRGKPSYTEVNLGLEHCLTEQWLCILWAVSCLSRFFLSLSSSMRWLCRVRIALEVSKTLVHLSAFW